MTEIVTDVGNRRRLPTWMLQKNAADKLGKCANGGTQCSRSEKESKNQAAGFKMKPVIKNHQEMLTEEAETKQQAESLQGCEKRRRTKKETIRDEGPFSSFTTCSKAKKKPKRKRFEDGRTVDESTTAVDGSSTTRKQRVKSKRPKNSEAEEVTPERSDEEISLTVEDLLSIAEEYVSADKDKQCEQRATGECTSETNPSSLSISSKAVMGGGLYAGELSQTLSKCTSSGCSSLIENVVKEGVNHKSQNFSANIVSTEDAVQEMLSLCLGPFLKKSPHREQSAQVIESKGLPSVQTIESQGVTSVYDVNKQLGSHALSKEEAPLMKKKSSLKDKVAMFF